MSAGTASLCSNFLFFSVFVFVSAGQKSITAESGQDVTLTCRAPNNSNNIKSAHWSRAGLGDKYVLLYRGGQFVPDHQHPSFKNRVDLQDRQMKDGDVSLILRNVSIADIGTYECRVYVTERHSWEIISNTALSVVVCQDKIITVESGQDVTLTCRAPNNNIKSVHWSRIDLRNEYVLLYRDGYFVRVDQHPSFKNRVDLQDRQMKDGDVSLILKDVTINDAGTYECRVFMAETLSLQSITKIDLTVVPPGERLAGWVQGYTKTALSEDLGLSLPPSPPSSCCSVLLLLTVFASTGLSEDLRLSLPPSPPSSFCSVLLLLTGERLAGWASGYA
ncbi:unnamed protein product [Oreochromis niloticus]|nr:unnamed protein product [Mustela putorius furo]